MELFQTQELHAVVRAVVTSHMGKHSDDYAPFLDGQDWESYLSGMCTLMTWGDELTLRAAADVYTCKINIITSDDDNWHLVYVARFQADSAVFGLAALGCDCCMLLVFRRIGALDDAIGSHACSLEATSCVRPMTFLSGVHFLTGWHCKFRPNTAGTNQRPQQ
jgi:hypothetical protein